MMCRKVVPIRGTLFRKSASGAGCMAVRNEDVIGAKPLPSFIFNSFFEF